MSHGDRHLNITVKGIICPTRWSREGEIERVSIMTRDEDAFEVMPEGVGRDLIYYPHRAVTASGFIVRDFQKRRMIRIQSFSVFAEARCLDLP